MLSNIYLWIIGVGSFFFRFNIEVIKFVWRHFIEALMMATLIGMFIVPNAMNNGAINYTCALLFMGILICLFVALIRIKILEVKSRKEEKND